jgi:hypothetical protein
MHVTILEIVVIWQGNERKTKGKKGKVVPVLK